MDEYIELVSRTQRRLVSGSLSPWAPPPEADRWHELGLGDPFDVLLRLHDAETDGSSHVAHLSLSLFRTLGTEVGREQGPGYRTPEDGLSFGLLDTLAATQVYTADMREVNAFMDSLSDEGITDRNEKTALEVVTSLALDAFAFGYREGLSEGAMPDSHVEYVRGQLLGRFRQGGLEWAAGMRRDAHWEAASLLREDDRGLWKDSLGHYLRAAALTGLMNEEGRRLFRKRFVARYQPESDALEVELAVRRELIAELDRTPEDKRGPLGQIYGTVLTLSDRRDFIRLAGG